MDRPMKRNIGTLTTTATEIEKNRKMPNNKTQNRFDFSAKIKRMCTLQYPSQGKERSNT